MEAYKRSEIPAAQNLLWDCVLSGRGTDTHALLLAQTYRGLKDYESGLARVNAALETLPDKVDLLYLAGYLHYRRNETKESMVLATKAFHLAPGDWRVHQLLALNYISFDMLEAAKLSLLRAISLEPDNAELLYQLARLYFSLGSFMDSIEISKKALALSPEYPEVYHNLALCYEGSGDVDLARQNFEKAIELDKKYQRRDEWPLIDFAVFQRMAGKPELSMPLLLEALRINPRSPKANYEMGELLRDQRRYVEARKYLEIAVDLDPCNARAIYGLAILSRRLGDAARASALFERFKAADKEEKEPDHAGKSCHTPARP